MVSSINLTNHKSILDYSSYRNNYDTVSGFVLALPMDYQVFITILQSSYYWYVPFIDEETEVQCNFPSQGHAVRDGTRI